MTKMNMNNLKEVELENVAGGFVFPLLFPEKDDETVALAPLPFPKKKALAPLPFPQDRR